MNKRHIGIKGPLPPHGRLASDQSVLQPISGGKQERENEENRDEINKAQIFTLPAAYFYLL